MTRLLFALTLLAVPAGAQTRIVVPADVAVVIPSRGPIPTPAPARVAPRPPLLKADTQATKPQTAGSALGLGSLAAALAARTR